MTTYYAAQLGMALSIVGRSSSFAKEDAKNVAGITD